MTSPDPREREEPRPMDRGEERLRAWAGCVRRLIAVAPISAVTNETGAGFDAGHSTPPERAAIRKEALRIVDGWLARDLAALEVPSDAR